MRAGPERLLERTERALLALRPHRRQQSLRALLRYSNRSVVRMASHNVCMYACMWLVLHKDTYIFYVVHACMYERMYVLTTICCSDLMAAAEGGPRGSSVRTPLPAPSPSSAARASAAVSAMWYGLAWIHIHFSTVK